MSLSFNFIFADDIPVQPEESGKLPTITEDDSTAKPKVLKAKQAKKEKAEKSRNKESRNMPTSTSNGDMSLDNVQVAVARGQHRSSIDTIELTSFSKGKESDLNSSPHPAKHSSPVVKSSSIKTSISNKDIKNTKMASGHTRNLSGGSSAGSENNSTDL